MAFRGSLYPEIRDLPGRMNHRMPPEGTIEEKFARRHDTNLQKGGVFEQIWRGTVVTTNSLHGQGIKVAGESNVIEGHAPDGAPEAIRVKGASGFALAVQWHPEWKAEMDVVSKQLRSRVSRLFALINAAKLHCANHWFWDSNAPCGFPAQHLQQDQAR